MMLNYRKSIGVGLFIFGIGTAMVFVAQGKPALFFSYGNVSETSYAARLLNEGRDIFRYDTFGSEEFWGGALRLHEAISGQSNGGMGEGVSPIMALGVGLKVDVGALPADLVNDLKNNKVDLNSASTTLALLKLDAVVGVKGTFDGQGRLRSIGIRCALCHSTVDNTLAKGIGHRLDGWPNRDLNVGAIIALSPDLSAINKMLQVDDQVTRKVLMSWGPGKFDPTLPFDGKAFRPDGKTAAVLLPPAYGLAGVNLNTYTGWGSTTHWNALVSNLEMHGKGTFYDPRLDDADKFPIAARNRMGHVRTSDDQVTSKLAALHFYQLSLPAPRPEADAFDPAAARRGQMLFVGAAKCATCHVPPLYTDPGWNMHKAAEIGIDDFQAKRSPDESYRTTPLRGLLAHAQGGYYHDGRFADLPAVVNHYNGQFGLNLAERDKIDLVEFLKSL